MKNAPKNAFPLLPHNSQQIRILSLYTSSRNRIFAKSIIDVWKKGIVTKPSKNRELSRGIC